MGGEYSTYEEIFIQGLDERAVEVENLLRSRGSWENDIEKYVRETRWEGVVWSVSVPCEQDKNKTTGLRKWGGALS